MPSNFNFDMTGVPLADALAIAYLGSPDRKAVAWIEQVVGANEGPERKRLVLLWTDDSESVRLPAPLGRDDVERLVRSWLESSEYGPEPRHDGDNEKGCRVYNSGLPRCAFVAVEPAWLEFGK